MSSETGFDPKLLDQFPLPGDRPPQELQELERVWAAPRGWALLTVVNNNYIGIFYVGAAFLFFLLAGVLALVIRTQLAPASSERKTPPESCSTIAHTRLGLAGETASPILPITPDGSPRAVPVSLVQVAPPSVLLWIP